MYTFEVPFSLGILLVSTNSHLLKTMVNNWVFKPLIVLKEGPLVNNLITFWVSSVPSWGGTDAKKPASLEVFAANDKHKVEWMVLKCQPDFIQTLKTCVDMGMVCLYEHFVLPGTSLLSLHLTDACGNINNECKADGCWKERVFAKIIQSSKNEVLSGEHTVIAGDVFSSYHLRGIKKPKDATPKAVKACFEIIIKLYEELRVKFEFTIGNIEMKLIFFNIFSAVDRNKFVVQQKDYSKLSIDNFVTYFQILLAKETSHCKQYKRENKEILEYKKIMLKSMSLSWCLKKSSVPRCNQLLF